MSLCALLPAVMFMATRAMAQTRVPDAPSASNQVETSASAAPAQSITQAPNQAAMVHPFWDGKNRLLFSGVAAFRALDYASTRNFQARGREETLLPDEVVNNSAGFAALEAAATGASVGLSYWMHRMGHHKVERWISLTHLTITAAGDVRNYTLKSGHRAARAVSQRH